MGGEGKGGQTDREGRREGGREGVREGGRDGGREGGRGNAMNSARQWVEKRQFDKTLRKGRGYG